MGTLLTILNILAAGLRIALLVFKTPAEKRGEFFDGLNNAMKSAENGKDPSDLSRIINRD